MRRYSHDSRNAALAAWAAWDQGKFWEMHDLLFEKAPELDRPALDELARQLGLDMARYKKAMDEQTHLPELQENLDRIHELDIWSTPTTIINGRVIKGAQPYENYKKIIDEALGKSSRRQMSSSFLSNILMDSQKVHQAGYMRSVYPGVGVGPGGFTSPGGGSRPRRDRPSYGSKRLIARLSILNHTVTCLTRPLSGGKPKGKNIGLTSRTPCFPAGYLHPAGLRVYVSLSLCRNPVFSWVHWMTVDPSENRDL